MKTCDDFRNAIMLAETGELARRDAVGLEDHLRDCPACRAWRADYEAIGRFAAEALPQVEPPQEITRRIVTGAEAPSTAMFILAEWKRPALVAAAAIILIAAGIWRWEISQHTDTVARASERAREVHALAALIAGAVGETQTESSMPSASDPMRELAQQLLILQGLDGETAVEDDTVNPDAELLPTTLRERSIPAFRATSHV